MTVYLSGDLLPTSGPQLAGACCAGLFYCRSSIERETREGKGPISILVTRVSSQGRGLVRR